MKQNNTIEIDYEGSIVYQIGDMLYDALPNDIAHNYFVDARQKTNDKALELVRNILSTQRTQIEEEWREKIKPTKNGKRKN